MKLPKNTIDNYFSKLEKYIDQLPLSEKGKKYIWLDSFCKFYDEPVQSEQGSPTYGIQTEWQLKRFINQFKENIKKLRLKVIENFVIDLDNIEPAKAAIKIEKNLYQITKKELLSEIGGESINDWQIWLKKFLLNEKQSRDNIFKNSTNQTLKIKDQNNMNIDYFKILIDGYLNPYSNKNMSAYFIAQSKKAERDEFIQPDIFYNNCLLVLQGLKNKLKKELNELNEDVLIDEAGSEFKHTIENVAINLSRVTNGSYIGDLFQSDILEIETEIEKAKNQIDTRQTVAESKPGNNKTKAQQEYRFETILPESVPDLFDELKKIKLITTTKEHFVWAFGIGQNKPADFKPIVWHGDDTLLSYMIKEVCQNKKKWEVAKHIFGVTGLAQKYQNCKGMPRGQELIDEILQEIG